MKKIPISCVVFQACRRAGRESQHEREREAGGIQDCQDEQDASQIAHTGHLLTRIDWIYCIPI